MPITALRFVGDPPTEEVVVVFAELGLRPLRLDDPGFRIAVGGEPMILATDQGNSYPARPAAVTYLAISR